MNVKSTFLSSFWIYVILFSTQLVSSQIWPASSWSTATNLTNVMDVNGITDLSGLHFNPTNNRLYSVQGDGHLRVLLWNATNNTFSQIANKTIIGGPEGITQANLYANEFYTIDENNYEIRRYTHTANFSSVTEFKHWNLLASPSPMQDTGNIGPEGIVFIPDSFLIANGFISQQTGQLYSSVKGLGGLFFVAHQDEGYVWVFDVNPNSNNDFAYVGKYQTNHTESCDLAFDRSTGLLYILHNIIGNNRLEVTNLSTSLNGSSRKFIPLNDYQITNPTGNNDNVEGFALTPKCPATGLTSSWLCRDVESNENQSIQEDALRWFPTFVADGNCELLSNNAFETTNEIVIYPNPVENRLIIEGKWILNATIQIYNSLGQLVLKVKNKTELVLDIDVSTLKSGMYFIQENQKDITYCNKFYKK
jgi:hypothetical protein